MRPFQKPSATNLFRQFAYLFAISVVVPSALVATGFAASPTLPPAALQCDSLLEPLGLDDPKPLFSWQLRDPAFGARQTAYQLQVATRPALLAADRADIWDSGKVASDRSVGVAYAGPALTAEKRFYWRVKAWNKDGKPYPASQTAWWETGLMDPASWQGKWIGYEEPEHRSIRLSGAEWITNPAPPGSEAGKEAGNGAGASRHDFRLGFELDRPIKRAVLYVTGRDTAAAWVNGRQALAAMPMPPWKQFPWQTYTGTVVTPNLHSGRNLLAVEVLAYGSTPSGTAPMSACLYLEMADGSSSVVKSDGSWKAAVSAGSGWEQPGYNDTQWQAAVRYLPPASTAANSAPPAGPGPPWPTGSVKLLRRSFDVSGAIVSARLYVTALGAYQMRLNGQRVGDQVLAPGWMDFRQHVAYQAYDVTKLVKIGPNAIGAYLAPGWYTTPLMWARQGYNYGDTPPALKAQLRIEHTDGSVDWIATDESWKADVSPILKAEIYDGERYDARREQPGWDTAAFPASGWKPAEVIAPKEPEIVAQYFPPIRVERTLPAKAITSPSPGTYIYDFGQNLAGIATLRAGGPAGTDVRLRFAEVLNPDGTIYTENLRTAKATDNFILDGKGPRTYQPLFTFHGFRYVEVTGLKQKPALDAVRAVVFHTDAPFSVELKTGSPLINQLWKNILWGQRSNFLSVPTDCPQRDERLGWTADAQVFWRAASYNMDLTQFSKKYAGDLRGTQVGTEKYGIFAPGTIEPSPGYAAGWSDAGVIIPWTAWLQSGDTTVIEANWSAMEKYLASIAADNPDYLWKKNYGTPYGDWLSPEGPTREDLVATAYWAYDVTLMKQMAHALGRGEDEARYAALFDHLQQAFAKEFVRPDGFVAGADHGPSPFGQINNPNAKAKGEDTQTGYVLALNMDLLPDSLRQAAADKLVDKIKSNGWRLGTGFLGTPYLLAVLVDSGHSDVAYRLLLNTDYPSWGYLVDHGATTMWERWNGDQMRGDPSMNSYNHYAYGAVADWIYRYAAGIDAVPSDAGFHTIYLHPTFNRALGSLDFTYQSPYGAIQSSWSTQGKHTSWKVTIPPNATAELPASDAQDNQLKLEGVRLESSKLVRKVSADDGKQFYQLAAGSYQFELDSH